MSEFVNVVLRIRPPNRHEVNTNTEFLLVDKNIVSLPSIDKRKSHRFIYDRIFDQKTGQIQVFENSVREVIDHVGSGYNSTIFVYGPTGSGKTYTLLENKEFSDRGMVPQACDYLFSLINMKDDVQEARLKCSFIEIYREHVRDLLGNAGTDLKLRNSPKRGVFIEKVTEKYVHSPEEINRLVADGFELRATATTSLNDASSRSHAIFTITLTQILTDESEIVSKLHFVDLAGSENIQRSEVQGRELAEAQNINRSLSCLGNVIYALTEKKRDHIPYRDSKLTFFLQDSLGGNSKTLLIATASPSMVCFSETLNTLKFAQRVKMIKNAPKINKIESNAELLKIIEAQKIKIEELETELGGVRTELKESQENVYVNEQVFTEQSTGTDHIQTTDGEIQTSAEAVVTISDSLQSTLCILRKELAFFREKTEIIGRERNILEKRIEILSAQLRTEQDGYRKISDLFGKHRKNTERTGKLYCSEKARNQTYLGYLEKNRLL